MLKCYWSLTACWTHINSGICGESNHIQVNWLGWVHKAFDIWGQMFISESWRSCHVSDRKELRRCTVFTISCTVLTNPSPSQYIIHRIKKVMFVCLFVFTAWLCYGARWCQLVLPVKRGNYLVSNLDPSFCINEPLVLFFNMLLYIFIAWVSATGQPFYNWKTCAPTWLIMYF